MHGWWWIDCCRDELSDRLLRLQVTAMEKQVESDWVMGVRTQCCRYRDTSQSNEVGLWVRMENWAWIRDRVSTKCLRGWPSVEDNRYQRIHDNEITSHEIAKCEIWTKSFARTPGWVLHGRGDEEWFTEYVISVIASGFLYRRSDRWVMMHENLWHQSWQLKDY